MRPIRRRFFDLGGDAGGRQIHYREVAGSGGPLLALHHLPGSSLQIADIIGQVRDRRVMAPDLAGCGDSDPHPAARPTIADYAADALALIDGLELETVDVFGSHTGAALAIELAIIAPHRIGSIILDGVPIFDPARLPELRERYAPFVTPDDHGAHLLWAHHFCRDQILFYPWYDTSGEAARGGGLPPAEILHAWVLEVIKGLAGFPLGYRAVFEYPTEARLPLVAVRTLCIAAADDTLAEPSRRAAALIPGATLLSIAGAGGAMAPPDRVAAAIDQFLGEESGR